MYKRYIVELGTGVDLHGMDVTKAAQRAVKDAVSHGCLCGLTEILSVDKPQERLQIDLKVAAPFPGQVDAAAVADTVPFGRVRVQVEAGGLTVTGLGVPALGDGDTIVVVNVALTVSVMMP